MTQNANGISLKKSKRFTELNGVKFPNLPSADKLVEGELAINYAEGLETISTKNESGNVVTFSSDDYFKNQYLAWEKGEGVGSAKIVGNSGITSGNFAISEGFKTLANGLGTHAEGYSTSAITTSPGAHAEGMNTLASNLGAHAEGASTIASGNSSHAEGSSTSAITDSPGAHAEGNNTLAYNQGSHAEGIKCIASGMSTHAEGYAASAMTNGMPSAHAEGMSTLASAGAAHAEGNSTRATGQASHAEGNATSAMSQYSHAEGQNAVANGNSSHAEGNATSAMSQYSHAEGENAVANGNSSHAEGYGTNASGDYSHAEGNATSAMSQYSHAEGENTVASGRSSHAEGQNAVANGMYSHAEGSSAKANGQSSHAEGSGSIASGYSSHAEGYSTVAGGEYGAHAEGENTVASGRSSHAEGYSTVASGEYGAHAEGQNAAASGRSSHAEGSSTKANGENSHAEGYLSIAGGNHSHAEGYATSATNFTSHAEGSYTIAGGNYGAHAEGYETSATSESSHAEGAYTITNNYVEHASGKFNVSSSASTTFGDSGNTLFSVGNGTATVRHNAFEIRQNGDIYIVNKAGNDVKLQDELDSIVDNKFGYASYNSVDKKIYFYKNSTDTATSLCYVDATDFIKDGMVDNVEVKNVAGSGTCLVITFNTDSGKEDINIQISDIFDANNYYTKSETSGATELSTEFALYVKKSEIDHVIDSGTSASTSAVSTSAVYDFVTSYTPSITVDQVLDNTKSASTNPVSSKAVYDAVTDNELVWTNAFVVLSGAVSSHTENAAIHVTANDRANWNGKLDATAYTPTDLSNYYTKSETSGATEISNALADKSDTSHTHTLANITDVTAPLAGINSITGAVGTMAFETTTSYSSATEVSTALSDKSDTSHTHDDRYYTESELTDLSTTVVVAKAASATTAASAGSVAWGNVTGKPEAYTPSAHNQASNTITAMTDYAKASTAAAIASDDTLNAAIGKLEKALDGKQASGSYVTTSRKVSTASGLTGGGDLSADRTIGLATVGTAGTYYRVVVDEYGRVTSGNTTDANTNYYTTGLTVSTAETSNTITVKGNNSAVSGTAVLNSATTSAAGLMSKADKSKLDGVSAGAEVNQNAWSKIKINAESTTIDADTSTDTLTVSAGTFVTLTIDATNDKFTIGVSTGTSSSTLARGDHNHDSAYQTKGSYLSATTKYAGSSETGGAATSANKLNTNAGNATTPVYFSGGVPTALSYTIAKSVPSDAKFTDTTYTFDGTYNASTNKAATVSTVTNAIGALDASLTGSAGAGKTLTAFSQTDGKVTATFGDISITKSQVSDFPTSMTPTAHNQASSTITAMTGYAIASASGAVATNDTLNAAIGKLEKRIALLEAALGGMTLVKLTSAQYEALTTKDPNTMYVIND